MVMGDYDWIGELRRRLHEQSDKLMALEGQMLADRLVAEERHRNIEHVNSEIKKDISHLGTLVSSQAETLTNIDQGQKSILQTMESDRQTRLETAKALKEADEVRRNNSAQTWVTPNRVITMVLALVAIAAYVSQGIHVP